MRSAGLQAVLLVLDHEVSLPADRRADVYTALYQLAGVEPPEMWRTKPSCCDEDDQPPAVDGAVLDDLVRRARSFHR